MDHEVKIHTIDEEDEKKDEKKIEDVNLYRSCCGPVSDKRLLNFIAMLSISIIALGFSFVQITKSDLDKDEKLFFTSLITMLIGIWLKQPI